MDMLTVLILLFLGCVTFLLYHHRATPHALRNRLSPLPIEAQLPALRQLWPRPQNTSLSQGTVDIVAIHGLDTGSPRTWEAYQNGRDDSDGVVHWLKDEDMLHSRFPDARIFTYDWPANTYREAVDDDLFGHAKSLLDKLQQHQVGSRPLIFIASCFGGLLLAKAMTLASEPASNQSKLIKSITGLIFFGTPFKKSDAASAARIRVSLAHAMAGETCDRLIRFLDCHESDLDEIVERFSNIVHNREHSIPIWCFYETRESDIYSAYLPKLLCYIFARNGTILVPRQSACIDGSKTRAMHVRHALLNKFFGLKDENFNTICEILRELVSNQRTHNDLQRVKQSMTKSPKYAELFQRVSDIPQPHNGTFEWILDDSRSYIGDNLRAWLSGDETIYWVNGKAGSGKSTLMKTVWSHAKTTKLLERSLCKAIFLKHSFWLPGTFLQKSYKGFLCATIIQLVNYYESSQTQLSNNLQWPDGDLNVVNWSLEDLSQLSKSLIATATNSSKVCLFIDGLDEIEDVEGKEQILDYFEELSAIDRTKICISSRFEEPWSSRFSNCSQLNLQDLNKHDISKYVRERLRKNWLQRGTIRMTDKETDDIAGRVASRAEGVFLWARLAVTSLLRLSTLPSQEEINAMIDHLPKAIMELYEDMLRRRNEDPDIVLDEAALYFDLLLDSRGIYSSRMRLQVHHCIVLRQLKFQGDTEDILTANKKEFVALCDDTKKRIGDICAGMISFQPFSTSDKSQTLCSSNSHEFERSRLIFHHRSVLDFLKDHISGQKLLQRSNIDEVNILNAVVEAELLVLRSGAEQATNLTVANSMRFIRSCHARLTDLNDHNIACAIRRVIETLNAIFSCSATLALQGIDYLNEHQQIIHILTYEDSVYYPAHDIAGLSLCEGIPSFFNVYLIQYLPSKNSEGRNLTREYMTYLLACAITGDLVDIALELVRAGADLHGTLPRFPKQPWVRKASDTFGELFFGPLNVCDGLLVPPYERRNHLHRWRHVLARHQSRSCYSVFRCTPSEADFYQYLCEIKDWTKSRLMLVLIDIGRCCQLVKADIISQAQEDTTRLPWEIAADDEYIGFAIDTLTAAFVPLKLETLQFLPCSMTEGVIEFRYPNSKNTNNSDFERFWLDRAPWMQDWYTFWKARREYRESGDAHQASKIEKKYATPERDEKLEMFWKLAQEHGFLYSSKEEGVMKSHIPRFEPA